MREQGDGLAALPSDEHGALGVAWPQSARSHPKHAGCGQRRGRLPAAPAQQRVPASRAVPRVAQAHASFAAYGDAERHQALGESQRTARPGDGHGRQPCGAETTRTGAMAATPRADAQLEAHPRRCPGQSGAGACVVTVDPPRRGSTQRTGRAGLGRLHGEGDLGCRLI
jgi:hypothetical protein